MLSLGGNARVKLHRTPGDKRGVRLLVGVFGALCLLLGAAWIAFGALLFGLVFLAAGGFGLRYALMKPSRPCPSCGTRVRVGTLDCATCGSDLGQFGQTQAQP
jgi:hypothetical protein